MDCKLILNHSIRVLRNLNPLNANPEKWSNTLKQIVGNLPTICLSVFDHFMNLALKGLRECDVCKTQNRGRRFQTLRFRS